MGRRAELLRKIAAGLRRDHEAFAALITREMGKPIVESRAEIEKCARGCEYYAEHGPAMLEPVPVSTEAAKSYVAYRPMGAILAIMPWNFPFWQVFRFAAPALMAGNVALLKHAPNVSGSACAIERLIREAGAPEGVFTAILIPDETVAAVIADERVAAVTLTGSERVGRIVAAQAGAALKKTVLELGGSDAFIVCADADVAAAVAYAVKSRFQNAGQSCIAAKRFLIDTRVYDAFTADFIAAVRALRVGDPLKDATQVGPLARRDLRDALSRQVDASIALGARVLTGATIPGGDLATGQFYLPTILECEDAELPVMREETFGPVAAVLRVTDVEEAIEIANGSRYGLGGNLWTRDLDRAERIAARLHSGGVFINGMTASDPRMPFGGVKASGYGRELSAIGMHEFMNMQSVSIT